MKSVTRIMPAFIAIASLVFFASCSKDSQDSNRPTQETIEENNSIATQSILSTGTYFRMMPNSQTVATVPVLCGSVTKSFISGSTTYGNIVVGNDATNYYFTVSGTNGWMLKKVRLFAGDPSTIPVNGGGIPQFNDYPVNQTFTSPYSTSWSFSVPIADLGSNFWISARVDYINGSGAEAGVWSEGDIFKAGNPSTKFNYTQQTCVVNEGCAYGQGYWFALGNESWPDANGDAAGDITVGNENYTRDEARAIWWANNGTCPGIADAKKAFAFVSAIRLSGSNVIGKSTLWSDMSIVDGWLETLDRLSESNICSHPMAPTTVKVAIASIGAWLNDHNCE
jgi:hypothetical protein